MLSVILVSVKIPKSTSVAAIARRALSKPAFRPQRMLYFATKKDPRQPARDGGQSAIIAMGFPPPVGSTKSP
jgi:hypothetical protein